MGGCVIARPTRPGVVRDPGMCRRSLCGTGDLAADQGGMPSGPHREGEEP